MSGFSFNLKGSKVTKNAKGKSSPFNKKSLPKKNPVFEDEDATASTKVVIDSFDSAQGAMLGTTVVGKAPVLVINPANRSHTLRKSVSRLKVAADEEKSINEYGLVLLAEDRARRSLLAGEPSQNTSNKVIVGHSEDSEAETAQEDYDSVPVDQFGAALLRGMGWSGETESHKSGAKEVSHRKKGAVLGIGAKLIEKDLEAELLSKKNLSVPLVRREQQNS